MTTDDALARVKRECVSGHPLTAASNEVNQ